MSGKNTSSRPPFSGRITVPGILSRKFNQLSSASDNDRRERIAAVTAYDFTFARLFDRAGVDIILVGDSLGTVIQGHESAIPVTLEEVIYHTRCVARAAERALVVGDLPFMSYQISPEEALRSAGRLIKEGGCAAVKLEGGIQMAETVSRLVAVDIPVMGHVGLTPQSFHRMGGHKVQGKIQDNRKGTQRNGSSEKTIPALGTRERVLADALALEEAGVFSVVLEGIPADLAHEVTSNLKVPTIGIGAGPNCDGQILVSYDMLGLIPDFHPRFVKRFAEMGKLIEGAVSQYIAEVQSGAFPTEEHSFSDGKTHPVIC